MGNSNIEISSSYTYTAVPLNMVKAELGGLYGNSILQDFHNIIKLYEIYDKGAKFVSEGTNGDYEASLLRYKKVKALIDKEARFLFSRPVDVHINAIPKGESDIELSKEVSSKLQDLVNCVLKENYFDRKMVQAAKDCFIGKRIAILANFNETEGINIGFSPSLEFVYDTDPSNIDVIIKIVCFYTIKDTQNKSDQRIYKKKYEMHEDGFCYVTEEIYDGRGVVVETIIPEQKTLFKYIPAVVVVNDGLLGDTLGESEVDLLKDYEGKYSKLANLDIDAERKSMNPIRWARDMSSESTKGLSISAGAFWDLASEDLEEGAGDVGVLESSMAYSEALKSTLDRLTNTMHEQVDVPNINLETMVGSITSGKALKSIYWGLIVRCNEKMMSWRPALESMVRIIIEGSKLYPNVAKLYMGNETVPDYEYDILVENNYPLPEDEVEEKQIDLAEVNNLTMSKKSYMMKWRGLTDDEADEELTQIALERQILEDSFMPDEPRIADDDDEGEGDE